MYLKLKLFSCRGKTNQENITYDNIIDQNMDHLKMNNINQVNPNNEMMIYFLR